MSEAETNSLINLGYDRTHAAEPEKALNSFGEAEAILEVRRLVPMAFHTQAVRRLVHAPSLAGRVGQGGRVRAASVGVRHPLRSPKVHRHRA